MLLQYSTGTRKQFSTQLFRQIGDYRQKIFIHRLGWELNSIDGMELDEFDGPDAVYICSHDDEGNVNGVARLLPTTAPYLMEKIFPHLWAGEKLPHDKKVWELSRFAAVDLNTTATSQNHQATSHAASEFLQKTINAAKEEGANSLVTVSPIGMERLLRTNKIYAKRTGLPVKHKTGVIVGLEILTSSLNF